MTKYFSTVVCLRCQTMSVTHVEEYHLQIPLETTSVEEYIRWFQMDVPLQDYRCQELVSHFIIFVKRMQLLLCALYFFLLLSWKNYGVAPITWNKVLSILVYANVFINSCVIPTNSLISTHFERCSQFLIMHNTGGGYLEIPPEIDVMKVSCRLEHLSRIFHFREMC